MKEPVLHYLWKFKKLQRQHFYSVDKQAIEIIHPGYHNTNAGPDFLNARININGIEWNGHVEIHVNSSEWEKHRHQFDEAYNNVILHIVYTCDQPVFTHSGIELIQAEIKDLVNENDIKNAVAFIENKNEIACLGQLNQVDPISIRLQKERAFFSRLEYRYENTKLQLAKTKNDWEAVFYQLLARAFGTNINQYAFERLAEILPLSILQKEGYTALRTEAIIFHYSGLLKNTTSDYALELKELAKQVSIKYPIEPLNAQEWKFSTMHANNFPTVRIAQFANLIYNQKNFFSKLIESKNYLQLKELFYGKASAYWDNHYQFEKPAKNIAIKYISESFCHKLIINAAVPILFTYGKYSQNQELIERCIDLLESIPAEQNNVVDTYKKAGLIVKSAFDSQALIELKNSFCNQKKCLTCGIGSSIINKVNEAQNSYSLSL